MKSGRVLHYGVLFYDNSCDITQTFYLNLSPFFLALSSPMKLLSLMPVHPSTYQYLRNNTENSLILHEYAKTASDLAVKLWC
jgi:hypothetical protein